MAQEQGEPFEQEARATVEELLTTYEVPPRVSREVARLREDERYIEALNLLVNDR